MCEVNQLYTTDLHILLAFGHDILESFKDVIILPISQQEILGIDQQLNNEQALVAKFKAFSMLCEDHQLKQLFEKAAAKHQSHYNTLLKQLHE